MSTPAALPGDLGFSKETGSCFASTSSDVMMECNMHTEFTDLHNKISRCNTIKYAAYRTASKLLCVQKCTYWNQVDWYFITIFQKHELNKLIKFNELEEIITEVYRLALKFHPEQEKIQQLAQNISTIIFTIHDRRMTGMVSLPSVMSFLIILAHGTPCDKFKYIIEQYVSKDGSIEGQHVIELLSDISRIAEYLHESVPFGTHMAPAAFQSCVSHSGDKQPTAITRETLLRWLLHDPQNIVWVSAFSRLQMAESVQHDVKCNVCDTFPIKGLRYRCLRCFNFNMCQDCFLTGQTAKGHKINHPVQEFCKESSSIAHKTAFWEILKNKLTMKTIANVKLGYLPLTATKTSLPMCNFDVPHVCSKTQSAATFQDGVNSKPDESKELESIIVHLEEENRHLQIAIDKLHEANAFQERTDLNWQKINHLKQEILIDHSHQLEIQLKRLRALVKVTKETLQQASCPDSNTEEVRRESTPANIEVLGESFDIFSPIQKPRVEESNDYGNDLDLSSLIVALQDFGSNDDEAETTDFDTRNTNNENHDLSLSLLISTLQAMGPDPENLFPPTPPLSDSSSLSNDHFKTQDATIKYSFKDISHNLMLLRDQVQALPSSSLVEHLRDEMEEILDQMEMHFNSLGDGHILAERNELLAIAQDIGNILANIADGFSSAEHLTMTPATIL